METIYVIIIALVALYLLRSKEGYSEYATIIPSYSSPNSDLDWLNVSDLEYGKLVTQLQGKKDAVRIRNLV
jgi:hypothetical protein